MQSGLSSCTSWKCLPFKWSVTLRIAKSSTMIWSYYIVQLTLIQCYICHFFFLDKARKKLRKKNCKIQYYIFRHYDFFKVKITFYIIILLEVSRPWLPVAVFLPSFLPISLVAPFRFHFSAFYMLLYPMVMSSLLLFISLWLTLSIPIAVSILCLLFTQICVLLRTSLEY